MYIWGDPKYIDIKQYASKQNMGQSRNLKKN